MRNSTLFDTPPEPPVPVDGRTEPKLWLRRLRIVDALQSNATEVRSIEFRRGLNIIATAAHLGDRSVTTVGHSVGKSLLTRLIRYCLGESSYAERSVREGICQFLPHGYVIADVSIEGALWHLARPIGLDTPVSNSWAAFEETGLFDKSRRQPYNAFIAAISHVLIEPLPQIRLPKASREIVWTDVLAWMSPDQGCAHKSHAEWRPGGADPSNRGLAIEDNHVVIRAVMDLLSADDSGLITGHKELLRQQGVLGRQIDLARAVLDARHSDALAEAKAEDNVLSGDILSVTLEQTARQQRESLERLLDEELTDDPVEAWRQTDIEIQRQIGATSESLKLDQIDLEAAHHQLQTLRDGEQELEHNAGLGEWCHLFFTEAEALAKGCPGKAPSPPGATDRGKQRRIRQLSERIEKLTIRVEQLQAELKSLSTRAETSRQRLNEARREVGRRRQPLHLRIEHYRHIERLATAYRDSDEGLQRLELKQKSLRQEIRDSLAIRRESDRRYKHNRQLLSNYFSYALSGLMGQRMDGAITINANGVFPQPSPDARSRGTALKTSTVFAFDIACLAAAIAGMGHHPSFLVHDSPRDADMEVPLYHRLFSTVADLENVFESNEPTFQCIVTTTTQPPKELAHPPFVRLMLDARKIEGFLLKHRF